MSVLKALANNGGGGGGGVTSFSFIDANGIHGVVTDPTTTPTLTLSLTDITPNSVAAVGTVTGSNLSGTNTGDVSLTGQNYLSLSNQQITANPINLSGSNATGTLAAGRFPALTGDISNTAGSLATTLATVNSNVGSFTNANITVNAKGLITAAANGTVSTGDVVGPSTATDNAISRFDGTTGKLIQDSVVTVSDTGVFSSASIDTASAANIIKINGTSLTAVTGSGAVVLATSPVLTTPNIGNATGNVSGNAGTATALQNARTIGGVSFDGTGNIVPQTIQSVNEASDTTCFPLFITASGTQSLQPLNNTALTFNASNGTLGATTFSGALSGNASTATALQTARNINGVAFDGTASITVTAAAGTLTGATLNSSVTSSSLTSLGTQGSALDMGSHRINNLTDPSSAQDAASKSYVDTVAQGLSAKASAVVATAAALPTNVYNNGASGVGATLTGVLTGVLTVDGVAIASGNRIVVKNEVTGANNGLYSCTTAGAVGVAYILTRATDADTSTELDGAFVFIESGTANAATGWVIANSGTITIGTTSITWTQFSGAGTYTASTGLTLTGTAFSITDTAVSANSYGSSTAIPTFTVNAQGQLTAASTAVVIAPAGTVTGTTLAANVVTSSLTTVGTIASGTWNASVIAGQYGGTGVANTGKTITLGGNFTTSGAFATTLTVGASTNVTLPDSGTLYGTKSGSITSSQLLTSLTDETGTGVAVFNTSPTFAGTATFTGGLAISVGPLGSDSWINMPTGGASGIGSGGVGQNLWVGYAFTTANYFSDAVAGDICYRNATTKRMLFGIDDGAGTAHSALQITGSGINSSIALTATSFIGPITGNASTATALQTARAIYGNNFDGTAALAQIIASTYGGTGNGFAKLSGPATSEKTFTLPNASDTIGCLGTIQTWTAAQSFNSSKLILNGSSSGTTTLNSGAAASSSVLTLPVATDTLVGKATTDTFTNKTFDTAGTGNSFSINGVAATANTGTGSVARATSPVFVTPTLGAASATSLSFSSTSGIIGTTTNNNAAAGSVGEYIESKSSVATNFPTTNQFGDVGSISLTAGDWDVTLIVTCTINGATFSTWLIGISTTSGNSATGLVGGENEVFMLPPTSSTDSSAVVPNYRMSLSGTTTVYGKILGTYPSGGPPQYRYRLSARRPR